MVGLGEVVAQEGSAIGLTADSARWLVRDQEAVGGDLLVPLHERLVVRALPRERGRGQVRGNVGALHHDPLPLELVDVVALRDAGPGEKVGAWE